MRHRLATTDDAVLLGELNQQLIEDEGHRNPMTPVALAERMRGWLQADYRALLLEDHFGVVAYALYREEPDCVHLRQLFVHRDRRSKGIGEAFANLLLSEIWPRGKRVSVEVLSHNGRALSFYRKLGFFDYSLALERPPH